MNNTTAAAPVLLRPEEAADALRVGRTTVFELIKSGDLRSIKIGHLRRIPVAALADYVAKLDGPPPEVPG